MNKTFKTNDQVIAAFLDGVDRVLNSNTFMLSFHLNDQDLPAALHSFVHSDDFVKQMLQQDIDRQWHNMHIYNEEENQYEVRSGTLVKENATLALSGPHTEGLQYLVAMLTGDFSKGSFYSFYNTKLTSEDAMSLVSDLIEFLFSNEKWQLFTIEPDFLTTAEEVGLTSHICYFEGDYGNDTATVLTDGKMAYLILTNGID